jgi:UDP-2,4-diacetamido-2,4,6-trideoxy-beta-L-altropyranose hydrolase
MTDYRPRIVIRADASPQIGGGHVTRCLALADVLSDRGCACSFATIMQSNLVVPRLVGSGHEILMLDVADDPVSELRSLRAHWPMGVDIVIVDHHQRDASYEGLLHGWARYVAAIDGLNRSHNCEILINPNVVPRPREPDRRAVPQVMEGGDYVLTSADILQVREGSLRRRAEENWVCSNLLVALGASADPELYPPIIEGIARIGANLRLVIVAGTNSAAREASAAAASRYGLEAEIHGWTDQMAQMLALADVAIGGGGGSLWDRCCLGVPSVTLVLSANQAAVTEFAAAKRATHSLSDVKGLTAEKIERAVSALVVSDESRRTMSQAASSLIDGLGCQRVSESLLRVLEVDST